MFGKTHRRIAREIAKELNLEKREAALLETGSITPDSWAKFPHHMGKDKEIAFNTFDARKFFLENDDECFHKLGIALHFIQDKWTSRPRISDKHTEWEKIIEKAMKRIEEAEEEINKVKDSSAKVIWEKIAYSLNYSQLEEHVKTATMPSKEIQKYLDFIAICKLGVKGMSSDYPSRERVEWYWHWYWESYAAPPIPSLRIRANKEDYLDAELRRLGYEPLRGFGVKVINFALLEHPSSWSTTLIDLGFAYQISLEVARNTLLKPQEAPQTIFWKEGWFDLQAFPKSDGGK